MALIGSIQTGGTANHATSSEEANGVSTDFVTPGVVGAITNTGGVAPTTGSYAVNTSSGMNVTVGTGIIYVTATPSSQASQTFRVRNTSTATVAISNNSSGSTKYDYIYVQALPANLNNPNAAGDNSFVLYVSRSSSTSSDNGTPPAYGTLVAVVTVTNGAIGINPGDISDRRTAATVSGGAGNLNVNANAGSSDAYIYAAGSATNINLNLVPKGTGTVNITNSYNPYKFSVYRAAALNSSASATVIPFDTKLYDTSSNVDVTTNKGRFTAPVAGFYRLSAAAGNTAATNVQIVLAFLKNGSVTLKNAATMIGGLNTGSVMQLTGEVQLAANDYVEVTFIGGGGSTMSVGINNLYFDGSLMSIK